MKDKAEPRIRIGDIPVYCAHDEIVDIGAVVGNPRNPNTHPDRQIEALAKIIKAQGWRKPITISRRSGFIVSGHGRYQAALLLNAEAVPVDFQDYASDAEEYADLIADNRIAELSELDEAAITELLQEIEEEGLPIDLTGYTDDDLQELLFSPDEDPEDEEQERQQAKNTLQERFIIPPFSILDSRTGQWQDRKRAWKAVGIKSEIGRGADGDITKGGLTFNVSSQPPKVLEEKRLYENSVGRKIPWAEYAEKFPERLSLTGTSIFDPVVCELFYRWFCPSGGKIIDPFAGGSVRGIVAALTGREYTGLDLSERQIKANRANWEDIDHNIIIAEPHRVNTPAKAPEWINADSTTIDTAVDGKYDLLFTCPPYADLEVYSDDPRDISTMDYPQFLEAYREIIRKAADKLKDNAFAVCVVGEVRDKRGHYYNFVGDTIEAFKAAGLHYYNENILVNAYASAAMRVTRTFNASRKNAKVHQNILTFTKGDAEQAIADVAGLLETMEHNGAHGQMTQNHEQALVFVKGSAAEIMPTLQDIADEEDSLMEFEDTETLFEATQG